MKTKEDVKRQRLRSVKIEAAIETIAAIVIIFLCVKYDGYPGVLLVAIMASLAIPTKYVRKYRQIVNED